MQKITLETHITSVEWDELTKEQQQLVEIAKQMTTHSYSPYSHFRVGAAVELEDGTIVKGSNQENAAYPSGLCAERTALFAANANYPDKGVRRLAIACYAHGRFTPKPGAPCAACRQVMVETEHRFGIDMEVILYGANETYLIPSARELVPLIFVQEDLNR